LPIRDGWYSDGPALPVEFSRQSANGRMTLAITDCAVPLKVLWSELQVTSLSEARAVLCARECVPKENIASSIGLWEPTTFQADAIMHVIANWAGAMKVDGVVWTALPPKFGGKAITPSVDQVIEYLSSLIGEPRRLAEEYVRRAPAEIATVYRRCIERALGWAPAS
jgi:hypothetical protein